MTKIVCLGLYTFLCEENFSLISTRHFCSWASKTNEQVSSRYFPRMDEVLPQPTPSSVKSLVCPSAVSSTVLVICNFFKFLVLLKIMCQINFEFELFFISDLFCACLCLC